MKTLKKVASIGVSILLWVIILLASLFAFATLTTKDSQHVGNLLGYTPLSVLSESMQPTFNSGDLIFIKKCDTSKLKEGDIITFHTIINNEYSLNTHRIEVIDETNGIRSYTTKGDNNSVSDTHIISDGDIVGKYVGRLPKMGKVMEFLSGSVGFFCVIILPMLLFFIYQIYHLIMISINLKKAIAAEEREKNNGDADAKLAEAEAALAEAKRLKAEAEALKNGSAEAVEESSDKE